jgi:hypothetical protein
MRPRKRNKKMIPGWSGKKKLRIVDTTEIKKIPRIPDNPNSRYAGKVIREIIFSHLHILINTMPYP